jgi:hypothetical protein
MNPETLARLRELAKSNYDVRDLLAAYDRLTGDAAERLALFDIDPTGGMTVEERDDYRRKFRGMAGSDL